MSGHHYKSEGGDWTHQHKVDGAVSYANPVHEAIAGKLAECYDSVEYKYWIAIRKWGFTFCTRYVTDEESLCPFTFSLKLIDPQAVLELYSPGIAGDSIVTLELADPQFFEKLVSACEAFEERYEPPRRLPEGPMVVKKTQLEIPELNLNVQCEFRRPETNTRAVPGEHGEDHGGQ